MVFDKSVCAKQKHLKHLKLHLKETFALNNMSDLHVEAL